MQALRNRRDGASIPAPYDRSVTDGACGLFASFIFFQPIDESIVHALGHPKAIHATDTTALLSRRGNHWHLHRRGREPM